MKEIRRIIRLCRKVRRIILKLKRKLFPRKRKKYNFVYLTEIYGGTLRQYYVGKHSTDNLNDGYVGSGNVITKYKQLNNYYGYSVYHFKTKILEYHKSAAEAYKAETRLIKHYRKRYKHLLVNQT